MDTDEEHLLVREAGAALATAKEGSHVQNGGKQMAGRKMCQPQRKLSWTRPCWMSVVPFLAVILVWAGSRSSSRPTCRFLSANVSSWRTEAEFLRDIDSDSRSKSGTPRTSLWSEQHRQNMRCASQMATAELQQLPICPRTPSRARQLVHESPPAALHGIIFCGLWGAWSMSVPEVCRPTRQTAWFQIAKWSGFSDTLVFPRVFLAVPS